MLLKMNENVKQHPLHGDSAASVAATPARKSVKDFYPKISSDDHWKIQDAHIAALSQADIMDLRNVEIGAVRAKKRCAIKTPDADKSPDDDDDDGADDDADVDEDDDDEALDILDLTRAIPPAPESIVPVKQKNESQFESRFLAKCAHSGSEITSGSSGTDGDDEKQHSSFIDDDPIMTRNDEKRVRYFMKKYIGSNGKKRKRSGKKTKPSMTSSSPS
jgi:hypothetical protein